MGRLLDLYTILRTTGRVRSDFIASCRIIVRGVELSARSVGMPLSEGASPAPVRPKDFSGAGFEQQTPVRWFHPKELARAGILALLSDLFGSFADKREIQAALNLAPRETLRQYELEPGDRDFWFDYVADLGDGFHPTYSIAWLLAQETLTVHGEKSVTQRGRLLFMGGDQVYPTAGREEYLNRTVGPYRAALPYLADESKAPHVYAVPGNHDWYDGLSAFLRQFAQKDRWIGAWRTQQTRSYFARKLPHGIWVWGIDIQLHADIDQPQLEYFDVAAGELEPGDRVILLTAEPSWVKEAEGDRAGYASLMHVMQKVTRARASVALVVTGDSHHYSHYVSYTPREGVSGEPSETHFVTAGGGGAFLHGTHTLPATIRLPASTDAADTRRRDLRRGAVFPRADESRALIRSNILSFPFKNWQFGAVWFALWSWLAVLAASDGASGDADRAFTKRLANALSEAALAPFLPALGACVLVLVLGVGVRSVFHTPNVERADATDPDAQPFEWRRLVDYLLWSVAGCASFLLALAGDPSPLGALLELLPRSPSASLIVGLVPLASALYVSRPFEKTADFAGRLIFGFLHGSLYVTTWLWIAALFAKVDAGAWSPALWIAGTAFSATIMSVWLFGGCLWLGGQYERALLNDAFSAVGLERFKNFLRFRIDASGKVTVFSIGLRDICREWEFKPERGAETSFMDPKEPLEPHLIERIEIAAPASRDGVAKESRNVSVPADA
jgi:hypothetical protein